MYPKWLCVSAYMTAHGEHAHTCIVLYLNISVCKKSGPKSTSKDVKCVLTEAKPKTGMSDSGLFGSQGQEEGRGERERGRDRQRGKTENRFGFPPWLAAVSSLPCHDNG